MNIEELIAELSKKALELESLMGYIDSNLESAPPGFLKTKHERGALRFYRVFDRQSKNIEYLGRDKSELRGRLSQKTYFKQLLDISKHQLKAVRKCLDVMNGVEEKRNCCAIMESMDPEIKELVRNAFEDDNERYARQWQSMDFGRWPNHSQVFTTLRGDRVRSKSEVLIADRLFSKGVPYHYETVFELYDGTHVNPDFRVLNKRTRKELLWEHLGMVDNPQYFSHVVDKMDRYSKSGVILGRNLILTLESSQRAISTPLIDAMIDEYLV